MIEYIFEAAVLALVSDGAFEIYIPLPSADIKSKNTLRYTYSGSSWNLNMSTADK
jgi:hypothetical protein